MDVFPTSDYARYLRRESPEERMRAHWQRTGKHLQKAMDRFAHEQQKPQ